MGGDGREKRQLPAAAAAGGEEEQMEEFFELLKSIREIKDRRRALGGCSPPKKAKVTRSAAWRPAFEWEDFAGDVASGNRPAVVPTSLENGEERKEKKVEEGNALDLKLSL